MRSGAIEPGESISEVHLAAELGVSRTPLREALIGLAESDQIEWNEGRGFRFKPLSTDELEELAPILATLEGLAIQLTDPAKLVLIGEQLLELAEGFSAEHVERALINAKDDEWHTLLTSGCPNVRLLDILQNTRQAFHRYEQLLVADHAMMPRVAAEHIAIAKAVCDGDISTAQEALRENWLNGVRRTVAIAQAITEGE